MSLYRALCYGRSVLYLQLDVIVADLDGGGIYVPEHLNLPLIPEPIYSRTMNSLFLVSVSAQTSMTIILKCMVIYAINLL